jgi:hypothetical protein
MMMNCGKWTPISVALAAGMALAAPAARADTYYPFVRITCVPQASYAGIETTGLYEVGQEARATLAAQGFQELSVIAHTPATCSLPQGELRVEVVDYHPPQLEGMCSQAEDANLKVSLASKQIAFAEHTHGGCTVFQRHEIQITEFGVQHCILELTHNQVVGPTGFSPIRAVCSNTWLQQ